MRILQTIFGLCKRNLILVWLLCVSISQASASDVVYIFVKISNTQTDEGIMKSIVPANNNISAPSILFKVRSKSKQIREDFIHTEANYISFPELDNEILNQMHIIYKEKEDLKFRSIDLNDLLLHSDKKSFARFCIDLKNKKVYFIEFKENQSELIELIEVQHIRHMKY
ncbi:MAG: hypothetical protein ACRDD8_11480 [Bacteroidales bacterium]